MTNDEFLRIARVIGAHALDGRLKIFLITDIIDRFNKGTVVFIKDNVSYKEYTIDEFKVQKGKVALLRLKGLSDRTGAERLKGREIFISQSLAEETRGSLEEDFFYYFDIIGCTVFLDDDEFGQVDDIFEAGSGDILIIIDKSGKKHMVPFVESMVDTKNLSEKRIDIYPVEGLLDI